MLLGVLGGARVANGKEADPHPPAPRAQDPKAIDGDWLRHIQKDIEESEYRITPHTRTALDDVDAAYQAPNRAHGLRTYFASRGIRVVPRTEKTPSWEWSLTLAGIGRPGSIMPVASAGVSAKGNRIDYERGNILEWYVNDPKGLEQGFTLRAKPEATQGGMVVLELALGGTLSAYPTEDRQAIEFETPQGARAVRYAGLRVTDATASVLPAHMEAFNEEGARGIRLVFDDAGATYPLTIDPIAANPGWTLSGSQAGDGFAFSTATAGDVNGDGYADVIVGAPYYDNGQTDRGRVFVYLGSAAGPVLPPWTADGEREFAHFGASVATAGDVDGNGYSDVIVGAPNESLLGIAYAGKAYVFKGGPSGLANTPTDLYAPDQQHDAHFGSSVSTAGDINGDGYDDVIIGAPQDSYEAQFGGVAYVFLGSSTGVGNNVNTRELRPNEANADFGVSVGTAGDVNGDGYADVIVGSGFHLTDRGKVYVYLGPSFELNPGWPVVSGQTGEGFGYSVGTAGDVNGDGYADVIMGASSYTNGEASEGKAFAYLGSADGLPTSPAWTTESNVANAAFGSWVATAGDVNGDGYADVIVGANVNTQVYLGSSSGLATSSVWTAPSGYSGGTAGDVNGDGYADVIVGSPNFIQIGTAYVYFGSPSGPATSSGWEAAPNLSLAQFGWSVASAGDVNGDGYADVIVGAPKYAQVGTGAAFCYLGSATGLALTPAWSAVSGQTDEQFGYSVASAGDVNGDGYSDVIIGSPYYSGGQAEEGKAFVYLGGASGLATSPVWTPESNQAGAHFGFSVATAGDVNGDGYSDVIIGAPNYIQGGTGKVFVYLGGPSGPNTGPAWMPASGQSGEQFGYSVASAGDVNRDGYSDVIIGSPYYSGGQAEEGKAFVYLGGASGLALSPVWTPESDQAGAHFGFSVASAGDVDGDGYSDVIVGAPDYTQGGTGKTFVYLGGPSGPNAVAAWMPASGQTGEQFGYSVAGAGDVNGDGYADVIVGAARYSNGQTFEGKAFVYLGSATGLAPSPAWTVESDQNGVEFGWSVASAGDVNGDGYADVIVGARLFDDVFRFEGRAFAYYGDGGKGVSLKPQQRRLDDAGPIAPLGAATTSHFRLAAVARNPFGLGKEKMEWEVKPFGDSLNGVGASVGASYASSGSALDEIVFGRATNPSKYHWRMRLRYNSVTTPFAQRSRWFTVPRNGWNEEDLRTANLEAGSVPTGGSGQPLRLAKSGGQLTLSWDPSCTGTDNDYGIYQGVLGVYYSHQQVVCSTGGNTSYTLPMPSSNPYYLVVPRNAVREGSYGKTNGGFEIPPGSPECVPQSIAACP